MGGKRTLARYNLVHGAATLFVDHHGIGDGVMRQSIAPPGADPSAAYEMMDKDNSQTVSNSEWKRSIEVAALKLPIWIIVAASGTLLSSCDAFLGTSVSIQNDTKTDLTVVGLEFPGETLAENSKIRPGASLSVKSRPRFDGDSNLVFVRNGRREEAHIDYVMRDFRLSCRVRISATAVHKQCQ